VEHSVKTEYELEIPRTYQRNDDGLIEHCRPISIRTKVLIHSCHGIMHPIRQRTEYFALNTEYRHTASIRPSLPYYCLHSPVRSKRTLTTFNTPLHNSCRGHHCVPASSRLPTPSHVQSNLKTHTLPEDPPTLRQ